MAAGKQRDIDEVVGERIVARRAILGLRQSELAKRMNTSDVQISRLETGTRKFTMDWLRRFAGALECKLSDLLPDEDVADRLSPDERNLMALIRHEPGMEARELLGLLFGLRKLVDAQSVKRVTRGALPGDAFVNAELADVWAELDDKQRAQAVELLRASAKIGGAPGMREVPFAA